MTSLRSHSWKGHNAFRDQVSCLPGMSPGKFLIILWVPSSILAWAAVSSSDLCLSLGLKPYPESA